MHGFFCGICCPRKILKSADKETEDCQCFRTGKQNRKKKQFPVIFLMPHVFPILKLIEKKYTGQNGTFPNTQEVEGRE